MNVLRSNISCVRSRLNGNRYFYSSKWCCSSQQQELAKVPSQPTWNTSDESLLPEPTTVDEELINHLERLSLVEFGNVEGIDRLKKAIRFADTLLAVDTSNVTPMANVLEDRALFLRDDIVTEGNCRELLLKLARKTMEEYYVAPPGNIPINKLKRYDALNTAVNDDS